jgi:DNA helicase-2/ATP-dependent DNA helicase PcrA
VREEGRAYGDCAVFYRTNAQSRVFERSCSACDVPYVVVGGVRFYDRAEVKDALSYLRLALNHADAAALRRIVNKPPRGIGKASLERAEELAEQHGTTLLEGLHLFAQSAEGSRAAPKDRAFLALIEELGHHARDACARARDCARARPLRLPRRARARCAPRGGGPDREPARAARRRRGLRARQRGYARRRAQRLELFLDQVALVADVDSYDRRDDRVSLMTCTPRRGSNSRSCSWSGWRRAYSRTRIRCVTPRASRRSAGSVMSA